MTTIASVARIYKHLSSQSRLIHLMLQQCAVDGEVIGLSIKELADLTGLSEPTIYRHLPPLEEAGLIRVERAPKNSRIPNNYYLTDPAEETPAPQQADDVPSDEEQRWTGDLDEPRTIKMKGMRLAMLQNLIATYGKNKVEATIEYANDQTNLHNPPGFVVAALRGHITGLDLSAYEDKITLKYDDGSRFITGEWAAFIDH